MNKKIIGLIIVLIILGVVAVGAYYFLTPQYKTFSNENIQVEIPSDVNFKLNDSSDSFGKMLIYYTNDSMEETSLSIIDIIHSMIDPNYMIIEPFTGITIISINPEATAAQESYRFTKNGIKETFNEYNIIDSSKHNYNGTIYDQNNQTGLPSVYAIVIFDDANMAIKILSSTDLDTVIHMAETLQIK